MLLLLKVFGKTNVKCEKEYLRYGYFRLSKTCVKPIFIVNNPAVEKRKNMHLCLCKCTAWPKKIVSHQ